MANSYSSTGITGYIGGDVFHNLYSALPDYEYVALVRTDEKAQTVKKSYPSVKTVLGELDDSQLLEDNAAKADIVIRV